ncbi:MAG: hypothetical protein ACF8Q5_10150 [Phycisphaerales bacterium JB040]
MGFLLLIVVYIVLGFMYAWITGIVAREEISVGTGVLILVLSGVLTIIAGVGLAAAGIENELTLQLAGTAVSLGSLTLMGKAIAKLEWKHALIIACVYSVLLFVNGLALGACAA